VVGFLSNVVIAGIFYGVCLALLNAGDIIFAGILQWLAYIFLLLALFHFVPGFPLDGGRLLRSFLWMATGNYERSTRITGWTGRIIGLFFAVGGILLLVVTHQWFVGAVLAFAGWVLYSAAAQSRRETILLEALRTVTAQDMMTKEYPRITRELNVDKLFHDYVLATGQHDYVVVDGSRLEGVVTMRNIKRVPRRRWGYTRMSEVMTPAGVLRIAHPQQSAVSVLEQMEQSDIGLMPVLENDEVIGVIAWDSLIRLVKTRMEFGT
jgi:CBS domain-containing protein